MFTAIKTVFLVGEYMEYSNLTVVFHDYSGNS